LSGFSAEWLALREPADQRARNSDLLGALTRRFAGRDTLSVVDLGCGAGSNLRALAPALPRRQRWRLVDHDAALLGAARERIARWGDTWEEAGADLRASRQGRDLTVAFQKADLVSDLEGVLEGAPHLVTAAALFDLVSAEWIRRLAAAVAAREAVFYTVLTYNGTESWSPAHPSDAAIRAAFHAHQGGDKGFGPAAGPAASERLAEAFLAAGYRVRSADSPWRLGLQDAELVRELAKGTAGAVRETGQVGNDEVASWLEARLSAAACVVGHTDLLAFPG
jgi:SAM-dependent methyltransferase